VKGRVRSAAACLVQVESGRCVIGLMRDGAWCALNTAAVSAQWLQELPSLIRREMLLAGWSDERPQIILSAHESPPVARLPGEESWPLQHVAPKQVNGYVPAHDMPLGMALSGA
jgi:hypothetical protein